MVWLYLAVALVAATGVFLLGRLVRNNCAKRRIVAWVGIAGFAYFYLFFALQGEYIPLVLGIGGTCVASLVIVVLVIVVARRRQSEGLHHEASGE